MRQGASRLGEIMGFAGLRFVPLPSKEGRVYHTVPDAVLYLLSAKGVSLSEIAMRSGLPLCAVVNLPNRPSAITFEEADRLAQALDAGVGDFAFAYATDELQEDDKISYKLLDSIAQRLCPEDPAVVPMRSYFG